MKASISQNANVHINAQKEYFQPIMDELKKEEGITLTEFMPMNVYACSKVIEVESSDVELVYSLFCRIPCK